MSNKAVTGSFQLMKSLNRSAILNKIRKDGPISRADIAKQTKLTPPTVSKVVKDLLHSEIIIEKKQEESHVGRRPTMLTVNAKSFHIIGLDVGPKKLHVVLSDLNANLIEKYQTILPKGITNNGLLKLMKKSIQHVISKNQVDKQKLIGIGVGMHGVVDVERGCSLFAPTLQLSDIPIKSYLEEEFELLVKVENDARAMALGEAWFGDGKGVNSTIAVNVGLGIDAGIIINGELFHGEHFVGGEIGHMTIDIDGPRCSCGNYGCLQTFSTGPAIVSNVRHEIAMGSTSILSQWVDNDLELIDGKLIHEAAKKGDTLSIEAFAQAGRYLGIGLTNLIHTLNPSRIIIGGGVSKAGNYLMDSVKQTIQHRVLEHSAKQTEILVSKLGDYVTAIGAISLLLVEIFPPERHDKTSMVL
ncbi:ROK family transcriptional regulator [Virgibacillus siamensis]|uniref:ROK family transcriptional regulator n=1 Tax=Virgibacillus siamensis TaxID=480071 RepID=UPI000985112A|nr:ROK family transcriptional regulator [Virgibacillus siamensis]